MRHSRASWTQQVNIYSKNEDVAHPLWPLTRMERMGVVREEVGGINVSVFTPFFLI